MSLDRYNMLNRRHFNNRLKVAIPSDYRMFLRKLVPALWPAIATLRSSNLARVRRMTKRPTVAENATLRSAGVADRGVFGVLQTSQTLYNSPRTTAHGGTLRRFHPKCDPGSAFLSRCARVSAARGRPAQPRTSARQTHRPTSSRQRRSTF